MKPFKTGSVLIMVMTLLSLLSPVLASDQNKKLVFGIHPYLHATTLLERFSPLTEYIGAEMNHKIHIRVASSYQEHIDAINQGKVDFAFMGPAAYIKLTAIKNGHTLLGRFGYADGKDTFRGAIIVPQNSSLTSLSELHGRRFAFGDPNSTLSSQVPKRLLADAGVNLTDLADYSHLKNHHNVALAVLMGKYDAGGIKEEVFHEYESRGLKALQWSPDIPSHIFIASSRMKKKHTAELRQLLLQLHLKPNTVSILQTIEKGAIAIIPTRDEDYAGLRKLIAPRNLPDKRESALENGK